MELEKKNSLQAFASSNTKIALEFLRVDKARFSDSRTPIPTPTAVVERQRKRMVNKRYMACMMARKQASRENEAKQRDNSDAIIKDMKSNSSKTSLGNSETPLLPWPGFRYHNNGDVRTLNNIQKQRRLYASMRAGQGHRQSTVEMPFVSRKDSHESKTKSSTSFKSRSVDSLKHLMNKGSPNITSTYDSSTAECSVSDFSYAGQHTTNQGSEVPSATDRKLFSYSPHTHPHSHGISSSSDLWDGHAKSLPVLDRKVPSHNRFNVSGVPSNRSIGSSRLNLNQFAPAIKPLSTSSVWCNGGEELMERASLIPKDSFKIRFGVSSRMLHQRKSDLDEYKAQEEKRSMENAKNIKKYIDGVKKHVMI